jgi:hypothetical protein
MKTRGISRRSFEGFSLELPREWRNFTEEGSSTFTFGKSDGMGVLQFSVGLYQSGQKPEISLDDLKEMLADFSAKRGLGVGMDQLVRDGSIRSIGLSFSTQGRLLRVWYVSDGLNVALATYNCRLEEIGEEVKECEDIVASIRFGAEKLN